jgi:hypothetical protein
MKKQNITNKNTNLLHGTLSAVVGRASLQSLQIVRDSILSSVHLVIQLRNSAA